MNEYILIRYDLKYRRDVWVKPIMPRKLEEKLMIPWVGGTALSNFYRWTE